MRTSSTAVRTTARALIARGIEPGDRVAMWAPNTYHWVVAALGAQYAGAAIVPINTRYTGSEALDMVIRTQAKALFVVGPFLKADRLRRAASGRPHPATSTTCTRWSGSRSTTRRPPTG